MYQGQGLEIRGQRKMPSGSDLAYGMKRGAELVLTTNNSKFDLGRKKGLYTS